MPIGVGAKQSISCLAGAVAVFATSPLDRMLRDMHTVAQHMLAGPERFEMAGRMLLGAEPVGMFI
jgi:hypothetical protein